MTPGAFLMCAASASERVLAEPLPKKARDLPEEFLAGYVATDAVPLLSLRKSQGPNCCLHYQAAKPTLTSQSPAAKPTLTPVLKIQEHPLPWSLATHLRSHCRH